MDPIQFIVEWIDIETPLAEEAQFMKDIQSAFGPSQFEVWKGTGHCGFHPAYQLCHKGYWLKCLQLLP